MRNTAILPSSPLAARLDNLLSSRFALQTRQRRLCAAADLPAPLRQAIRQLVPRCEWRAFGPVDTEVFVAIARAHQRECRATTSALELYQMDASASVYAAAVWEHDPKRGWWLDSVLDPSYDCDHGWWLADLIDMPAVLPPSRSRRPAALLEHV
jgi:hypothetical protein